MLQQVRFTKTNELQLTMAVHNTSKRWVYHPWHIMPDGCTDQTAVKLHITKANLPFKYKLHELLECEREKKNDCNWKVTISNHHSMAFERRHCNLTWRYFCRSNEIMILPIKALAIRVSNKRQAAWRVKTQASDREAATALTGGTGSGCNIRGECCTSLESGFDREVVWESEGEWNLTWKMAV